MTTDEQLSVLEARLEARLDTLRAEQAELSRELKQARVDRWQDRIEDLELQIHLGAVEGNERLAQATKTLRSTWDQTRTELLDASSDAVAAGETLHRRVRSAYDDARTSLVDAKNKMSR